MQIIQQTVSDLLGKGAKCRPLAADERIDSAERQLLPRIVEKLRQAEGRVGEVQVAVLHEHEVVGAVEALALVAVDDRGALAGADGTVPDLDPAYVFDPDTTLAIVAILLIESAAFFEHVSLWDFLTDNQWTQLFSEKQ